MTAHLLSLLAYLDISKAEVPNRGFIRRVSLVYIDD